MISGAVRRLETPENRGKPFCPLLFHAERQRERQDFSNSFSVLSGGFLRFISSFSAISIYSLNPLTSSSKRRPRPVGRRMMTANTVRTSTMSAIVTITRNVGPGATFSANNDEVIPINSAGKLSKSFV